MTLGYLESVEVQTEEICLAAMKICGRTNINNCINFMNNKMQAANHFRYYDDLINYAFMDKQTMSQVYVTAVEKPNKFYVQNTYSFNMLERLNEDMSTMINDLTFDPAKHTEFLKRTWLIRSSLNKSVSELSKQTTYSAQFYCIARHNYVGNRGCINDFRKSIETGLSEVQVFLVDYGAYRWVKLDDIYPKVDKFIRDLTFQAIKCSLGGIESTENGAKWIDD